MRDILRQLRHIYPLGGKVDCLSAVLSRQTLRLVAVDGSSVHSVRNISGNLLDLHLFILLMTVYLLQSLIQLVVEMIIE